MDNKVVLITGGSDGLGKIIAKRLTKNYKVVILSRNLEELKRVSKQIGCDFVVADVTDYESLQSAVDIIIKKYGHIDVLINNAGVWIQGEVDSNNADLIEQVIKVNALGTIFATKAVVENMKKNKSGLIININSQAGISVAKERSVYYASKWAVTGFTKSLQPELSGYGIGVTQILPGGMKTRLFDKAGNPKDQTNFLDPQEVARVIEFMLTLEPTTVLTEIGIKHINN